MDNDFTMVVDDVNAVLSKESEVILTGLTQADCLVDGDDKHDALADAMRVADGYTKLFEAASKFEQQRKDAEIKQQELDLKRTELEKKDQELELKRSELELKSNELNEKIKENEETAVQAKRAAKIETVKSIGDTVLKCGLLFAQGALYVWGINRTFDFEQYHAASTNVGRSLLNNVSSLFIKK